jgi:hypothetical protein
MVIGMKEQRKSVGRPRKYPIKDITVKYTRKESVYDAIKILCRSGSDLRTILHHSNKLYVRHGGTTMLSESAIINVVNTTLDVLVEFNIIYEERGIYRYYHEELEIERG